MRWGTAGTAASESAMPRSLAKQASSCACAAAGGSCATLEEAAASPTAAPAFSGVCSLLPCALAEALGVAEAPLGGGDFAPATPAVEDFAEAVVEALDGRPAPAPLAGAGAGAGSTTPTCASSAISKC